MAREKTFTKIYPAFKKMATSPRMSALDMTTLFNEHGYNIPYATMYGYYKKAVGEREVGHGLPRSVADAAKQIWASYRDANPELFGERPATPSETGIIASAGPSKESPSQMAEQLEPLKRAHSAGGDARAKSENWQDPFALGATETYLDAPTGVDRASPETYATDGHIHIAMPGGQRLDLETLTSLLRTLASDGVKSITVQY